MDTKESSSPEIFGKVVKDVRKNTSITDPVVIPSAHDEIANKVS